MAKMQGNVERNQHDFLRDLTASVCSAVVYGWCGSSMLSCGDSTLSGGGLVGEEELELISDCVELQLFENTA